MKIYWHDGGHITKMAAMPIYGKNPSKIFLSGNRWTDFLETWHVASVTPAHHSLFKWWPWLDLDVFYGNVKFGNIGLSIGKSEKDLKPIEIMKICAYWRSRSYLILAQGHLHLKIKTCFSQKWLGHFEPNFILCLAQISGERFTGPLVLWS